jgi:CheY-like chemotaxis protein
VRVLVCDDEPATRFVISRVLTQHCDCEVTDCADGIEALRHLAREPFSPLFLDLEMPHMNGMQVLERLRASEATRDLPVIVLSGERRAIVVQQLLRMGITDYILKPPQRDSIVKRVADLKKSLGERPAAQ